MGWDDVWIDARPTIDEGLKGRSVGGGVKNDMNWFVE